MRLSLNRNIFCLGRLQLLGTCARFGGLLKGCKDVHGLKDRS